MIALATIVPLLAQAAEAEVESKWGPTVWGMPAFVWHAVNFLIFAAIIFFAARAGVVASAKAKRDRIARDIEEATKLRDEMRAKFEDYDARMKDIDARMNTLITDARNEAETEKKRIIEEASKAAARMRTEAKTIADQEIARARRELQDEQIARAGELAEQMLRTSVNKDDQSRLSQEFLTRIEGGKAKGRPA